MRKGNLWELKIPNWCNGLVEVTGKPKNIRRFCKLFICENDTKEGKKFFARSFTFNSRKNFNEEIENSIKDNGDKAIFTIDFAWSCHSCLIDGYPNGDDCVTIEWACKKFKVDVEIETEEGGLGFEEKIIYDREIGLIEKCKDMPTYICECGNKQCEPSDKDISDIECWECGKNKMVVNN